MCNSFSWVFVFFTVLTSYKLHCASVRLPWHSVPLFICIWSRVFIPLLQPPTQSCFSVTATPGHCKHTSLEHNLKKQRNWRIKISVSALVKGPVVPVLFSTHSNVTSVEFKHLKSFAELEPKYLGYRYTFWVQAKELAAVYHLQKENK